MTSCSGRPGFLGVTPMTNVWADPFERVGTGRKRHLYEQKGDGAVMTRLCGATDWVSGRPPGVTPTPTRSDLDRIPDIEFAQDPNACKKCLDITGLDDVDLPPSGAASVDADPFGVFDDDADMDAEFVEYREQDPSDRVEDDADPDFDGETPGVEAVEPGVDDADDADDPIGKFSVDLSAMDDDEVIDWVTSVWDVPTDVVRFLLVRPGVPQRPDSEDAIAGLKTATRYVEQNDVRRSTGQTVSQAYHDLKNAVDTGDVDV